MAAASVVPPMNPAQSLPPNPNFTDNGACAYSVLDESQSCNTAALQAIDYARASLEGMPPASFNMTAFDAMTVSQQLFVVTNLERTDRSLPPIAGLTTQLDNAAQTGAGSDTDPTLSASSLTGGARVASWGSLWAGGTSNPLGSDYYWMYDDGYNSPNASCTNSSPQTCWGHRDQILGTFSSSSTCYGANASEQYMGAGYATNSSSYGPSFTEILVGACGAAPTDVVFTWSQAEQLLGAHSATAVASVSPGSGLSAGGTSVTISGSDFTGATAVSFGAVPAASFTVNSASSIGAISPAHTSGTVDITVTGPGGTSALVPTDQFTFVPASHPDFTVAVAPPSQNVKVGQGAVYVVSLGSLIGDSSPVTLSVRGAPAGTTLSSNPPAWSAGGATSTMSVPASAPAGSYAMTITGADSAGRTHSASAALAVTSAPKGTANIMGSVYSSGVDVSDAIVTVLQNGAVIIATTTNSAGSFTITGLAQGSYSLTASAPGFASNTVSVTVFNGNWTKVGIPLSH